MDAANEYDTPAGSGGKRLPQFQRNNFGGSFGGPIKKDHTFFFGVYEGLRQKVSPAITTTTFNKGCFVDATGALKATLPATIDNGVIPF